MIVVVIKLTSFIKRERLLRRCFCLVLRVGRRHVGQTLSGQSGLFCQWSIERGELVLKIQQTRIFISSLNCKKEIKIILGNVLFLIRTEVNTVKNNSQICTSRRPV
jgi:hypothetical protein